LFYHNRKGLMKKILSIGQCGFDSSGIKALVESVGAEYNEARTFSDANNRLLEEAYDLVLVNRVTDADGSLGINFIGDLLAERSDKKPAVMMVSNYEEAQRDATALGAVEGFGKQALKDPETRKKIEVALKG